MRIEVKSAVVDSETRRGRDGSTFQTHEQTAFLVTEDERRKIRIRLPSPAQVYSPGAYTLSGDSFSVNSYGSLEIARVVLVPVKG